jgi:DNA-binding FrmR family transcriptional regulator
VVDSRAYCIDIKTQVSADTKGLEAVALGLLKDHLRHCLTAATRDPSVDMDAKVAEASAAVARLVRS